MDNVFANLQSAPAPAKRSRDQVEGDPSPGKRIKVSLVLSRDTLNTEADDGRFEQTNMLVEEERAREQQAALAAPPPSPTPHWSTALAKQQQRALEMMQSEAMDEEDIDMGGGEDHLPSNPEHPWNSAGGQRMMHQLSTTSLSGTSSSNDSSMPNTPLDLPFNEQWDPSSSSAATPKPIQPGYPSSNNPTSFTNLNGATVVFSISPPLSVYPPPPVAMSTPAQHNPLYATAGFPMHGWSASTSGVLRMTGPSMGADAMADESLPQQSSSAPEVIRELNMPTYGWDVPRQSNSLNMGAHLV